MEESLLSQLADAGWMVERVTQRGHALWRATRPGWVRSAPTLEDLARDCERAPLLLALDLFAGRGGATACPDVLSDLAT